ncbi:hypothetical protein OAK98_03745 [Mariniblastus sp.]|nr:hypothetical protein [Mariniblastus sp.]
MAKVIGKSDWQKRLAKAIGGLKVNAKRKKHVAGNICIWFDITRMRVQLSRNICFCGALDLDTETEAILPGIHGRSYWFESGYACWL